MQFLEFAFTLLRLSAIARACVLVCAALRSVLSLRLRAHCRPHAAEFHQRHRLFARLSTLLHSAHSSLAPVAGSLFACQLPHCVHASVSVWRILSGCYLSPDHYKLTSTICFFCWDVSVLCGLQGSIGNPHPMLHHVQEQSIGRRFASKVLAAACLHLSEPFGLCLLSCSCRVLYVAAASIRLKSA